MAKNQAILEARARKGWSQEVLARRARMSANTVNRIELGIRTPTVMTKYRLAKALGVEVAVLFPEEKAS